MENARIFLVEDDKQVRGYLKLMLEELGGHQVVEEAINVQEAEDSIGRLMPDEGNVALVDVALVDGNLDTSHDQSDGARVAAEIRTHLPGLVIVGISGGGPVEGAHVDINKNAPEIILEYINKL